MHFVFRNVECLFKGYYFERFPFWGADFLSYIITAAGLGKSHTNSHQVINGNLEMFGDFFGITILGQARPSDCE